MILWTRRVEKDAVKQKVLSFQEDGQKRKMVIKTEFTPELSLTDCKNFPFKRGFKKYNNKAGTVNN